MLHLNFLNKTHSIQNNEGIVNNLNILTIFLPGNSAVTVRGYCGILGETWVLGLEKKGEKRRFVSVPVVYTIQRGDQVSTLGLRWVSNRWFSPCLKQTMQLRRRFLWETYTVLIGLPLLIPSSNLDPSWQPMMILRSFTPAHYKVRWEVTTDDFLYPSLRLW